MKRSILLAVILAGLLAPSPVRADEEGSAPDAPVPGTSVPSVPEVSVTATRRPRELQDLSDSATVVDREAIDLKDAWSLEQALTEYAGIDVVGNSNYGQEVRLTTRGVTNGYGTQRTLVLLQNRPLTGSYLGSVDLSQYPLGGMDRVELVRGPASAVYGSNALGGVVNLIPRRGSAEQRTDLLVEGGTFSTGHLAFSHGTMFGPVDFNVSVDGVDTNGYLENSQGDDMDWSAWSGIMNVGYEEDRFGVRFLLYLFDGDGTDEDYDRDVERNMQDVIFTYEVDPERDAHLELHLYRSQLDQTLEWFFAPKSDYDQTAWGAILTQSYRVHEDHLLIGGLEWRLEDAKVKDAVGKVDEKQATWSVFLQDEFQVTEDLGLVAGLRYDNPEGVDGQLSWRAGANWRVVSGTNLRAAAGHAFRAPTISDRYLPTTSFFGMTFEGNPDLDPEKLDSVEVGVDQRIVDGVTGSATVYASQFKDFWDFAMEEDGVFRPQNIGKVRIYGLEAWVDAELGEGFSATAGYTFTDAEYRDWDGFGDVEGNRLDDNVRHRGSASVTWRHAAGHMVRLGVVISGDRYTDAENSSEGKLDSWFAFDLQAVGRISPWLAATLTVRNLLNRGYRTKEIYREPGRAIMGGVRLTF